MKFLIKLNIFFFTAYFLFQFLEKLNDFFVFNFLNSVIGFIVTLVLFGINSTVLIELVCRKKFDFWEFAGISSAAGFIFPPLLVTTEFSEFSVLSANLPVINSFIIFIITAVVFYFKKHDIEKLPSFNFVKPDKKALDSFFSSPLFWISVLYISIIAVIFSAYYALPDLDPFYWIQRYSNEISANSITKLTSDRPLFLSLLYILNQGSHIETYTIFKHILPLLSIAILFPAWLVARRYPSKIIQTIILLLPFASSSTILYLETPMPQAVAMIVIFYFFFFLIYSWLFERPFFYYFAGVIAFFGSLYHEVASIISAIWIFVTLLLNRKIVWKYASENKLTIFLIATVVASNTSFIKNLITFILYWTKLVLKYSFFIKTNFLFPAYYVNMNGQSMGWAGFAGVSKYYIYYAGPFFLLLLFLFACLFIVKSSFRKKIFELKTNKEFLVLFLCFLVFFSISEILPRLFNFPLLPERAWIFTGTFLSVFFFAILKNFKNQSKYAGFLAIFLIAISIGGALYINNLKKFIITGAKIHSAEWIKNNLPSDRIFLSDLDRNLLKYYGKSEARKVPTEFFFEDPVALEEISKIVNEKPAPENSHSPLVKEIKKNVEELDNENLLKQKNLAIELLEKNIQKSNSLITLLNSEKLEDDNSRPNFYIYYSKPNELNPYIKRPYHERNNIIRSDFVFDKYPEKFQRIYEDRINSIIIWKIL